MQVWLASPEILAREHNALRFRRLTSFEHAAAPITDYDLRAATPERDVFRELRDGAPGSRQLVRGDDFKSQISRFRFQHPALAPPDKVTIANLTMALDSRFARHQHGADTTRVEVYPMDGELWFLIRHGDLFKRVAKVERQNTDILHFRPRRDDVVVYSWRLNELRVNARTKAERDLYIREFGAHLHGDPDYFSERRPYTLEPLREFGREALDTDGLDGIRNIRLCRLAVRLENANNDIIIREADDLFYCPAMFPFDRGRIPGYGALERALFEIQFAGSLKSYPVEIRVPNVLKMNPRCDPEAIENWLCRRGFRRLSGRVREEAYSID